MFSRLSERLVGKVERLDEMADAEVRQMFALHPENYVSDLRLPY